MPQIYLPLSKEQFNFYDVGILWDIQLNCISIVDLIKTSASGNWWPVQYETPGLLQSWYLLIAHLFSLICSATSPFCLAFHVIFLQEPHLSPIVLSTRRLATDHISFFAQLSFQMLWKIFGLNYLKLSWSWSVYFVRMMYKNKTIKKIFRNYC